MEALARQLGRRIRRIRQEKGLTLKGIESKVGVSATHLSEIERGKTSPTITALEKIARGLEVDTSHLIDLPPVRGPVAHPPGSRPSITVNQESLTIEPLTLLSEDSEISVFLATIDGSGRTMAIPGYVGEEFCLVLEGFLEIVVDGRPHILRRGDSIHFRASSPHQVRNLSDARVRALWAVQPKLSI